MINNSFTVCTFLCFKVIVLLTRSLFHVIWNNFLEVASPWWPMFRIWNKNIFKKITNNFGGHMQILAWAIIAMKENFIYFGATNFLCKFPTGTHVIYIPCVEYFHIWINVVSSFFIFICIIAIIPPITNRINAIRVHSLCLSS